MEILYKGEIKRLLPIFQAMAEGKTIQVKEGVKWKDIDGDNEGLNLNSLIDYSDYYRIKPSPTYRPFKDAEECWQEMQKHQPFGWVKFDCDTKMRNISSLLFRNTLNNEWIELSNGDWHSPHNMFKTTKFADGTPFGKLEEE